MSRVLKFIPYLASAGLIYFALSMIYSAIYNAGANAKQVEWDAFESLRVEEESKEIEKRRLKKEQSDGDLIALQKTIIAKAATIKELRNEFDKKLIENSIPATAPISEESIARDWEFDFVGLRYILNCQRSPGSCEVSVTESSSSNTLPGSITDTG